MTPQSEYFRRWMSEIKPVIEGDDNTRRRIQDAFASVVSTAGPLHLQSSPLLYELGTGRTHSTIGLGVQLIGPLAAAPMHYLALKVNRRNPYNLGNNVPLEDYLGAFEYQFQSDPVSVPYFVGVVAGNDILGRPTVGILTEDISRRKTCRIIEEMDSEWCTRVRPNGRRERIFIDPNFGSFSQNGELYLQEDAVVKL